MSSQFAADGWATSPPFRPDSAPQASRAMSAVSRGSGSVAAAGWNGSQDALAEAATAVNHSGALVKASPTAAAVAITYPSAQARQTPFSGLYEDVSFTVHTLFSPPRPPGEQLPRVKRPNRNKAAVYTNDVARAGTREHNAQREVSRVWRGVLCRRRLRQAREMDSTLSEKARAIQCWWRGLQAVWRRRQLSALRSEWAKERMAQYIAGRVLNTTSVIYWQHAKYEEATLRIQRAVRWHLREKERARCAAAGLPQSEWPPALARPVAEKHHPYFPWRRPQPRAHATAKAQSGSLVEAGASDVAVPAPLVQRTLLQFRDRPQEVQPPTQEAAEAANAKMRAAQGRQAAALQSPEALSRREWKTEGMRQEDLDFNAGVVQRLYRSKRAPETMHTKELTAAYFNKAARTIARTFRMYVLIKRMRTRRSELENGTKARMEQRDAAMIADLKSEAVWQKDLMDAAAKSIQRCWAWYRYRYYGVVPASCRAQGTVPSPPSYGLITAHREREHALRWSTMNLLEQRKYEEQREHKYFHYIPAKIELYKHTGFLFVQTPRKA